MRKIRKKRLNRNRSYLKFLKLIILQSFVAYYIFLLALSFVQIGIPTNAYFSDSLKGSLIIETPAGWNKSSLVYVSGSTELNCSMVSATFKNKNDAKPMTTYLRYGVYKDVSGNQDVQLITKELKVKLGTGEAYRISLDISKFGAGKYVIRVFQEEGHPGNSHPPSDSVKYDGVCGVEGLKEKELQNIPSSNTSSNSESKDNPLKKEESSHQNENQVNPLQETEEETEEDTTHESTQEKQKEQESINPKEENKKEENVENAGGDEE